MTINNIIIFQMESDILHYDIEKSILLCKTSDKNRKRWIKKIEKNNYIVNIIEDRDIYYITCEENDTAGLFLAISKKNGTTIWDIPGKSFLQETFDKWLYLIFVDDNKNFYLIKVDKNNGNKIWHHSVDEDLKRYSLRNDRIELTYSNGETEIVCSDTGRLIN